MRWPFARSIREDAAPMNVTLTGTGVDAAGVEQQVTVVVTIAPVVTTPPPLTAGIPSMSPAQPSAGFVPGSTVTATFSFSGGTAPVIITASASDGRTMTPVAGQVGVFTFVA